MGNYKYSKGSKWVAIRNSLTGIYVKGEVITVTKDSDTHLNMFEDGRDDYSVITENFIPHVESSVETAKIALEKAHLAYEVELKKHEDSLKFTEDDVKNLMIVVTKDYDDMRMVVIQSYKAFFYDTKGNLCKEWLREALVRELNYTYKKTNLTLKDFANHVN